MAAVFPAQPADALVKGNAPPAGYNKKRGSGGGNGERGELFAAHNFAPSFGTNYLSIELGSACSNKTLCGR